jgi:hypothetical protein
MLDQHWRADDILEQARTRDIVTMITLMNMGDLRASGFESKWGYNVYNSAKGGPCSTPQEFFTNASAKTYFKRTGFPNFEPASMKDYEGVKKLLADKSK